MADKNSESDGTRPPSVQDASAPAKSQGPALSADTELRVVLRPPFHRELGHCWLGRLANIPQSAQFRAVADDESTPRQSTVRVYEDGIPLSPAHSRHLTIRRVGRGAFSHWKDTLYFSSTDGTDPNSNGRSYELCLAEREHEAEDNAAFQPQHRPSSGRSSNHASHDDPLIGARQGRPQLPLSSLTCRSLAQQGREPEDWRTPNKLGNDVFVYRVEKVLYLPEDRFPICGDFVPEESINHRYHFEMQRFGDAVIFLDGCSNLPYDVCILGNIFSNVFGHWMEELLKVVVLESFGFDGVYVIAPQFPEFCFQSLRMLGVPDSRVLVVETATEFKQAYFITNISHMNAHRFPHVIKYLRSVLYEAAGHGHGAGRRIWVERGSKARRNSDLVNRQEVETCIKQHGFEQVDYGALDFKRQIHIDREMDTMAGIHGSAFVHCGFMKDRGHVIEAFSPNYINPSVISLCLALEQKYNQMVEVNAHGRANRPGTQVEIDLTHLELILRSKDW